jgi:hypothetical protein
MTSAYPKQLDRLARQVQAIAERDGRLPSRNHVMRTFKVGGPKARAALNAVKAVGFTATAADSIGDDAVPPTVDTAQARPRRLHSVPSTEPDTEHDTATAAPGGTPAADAFAVQPEAHADSQDAGHAGGHDAEAMPQISTPAVLGSASASETTTDTPATVSAEHGRLRQAWAALAGRQSRQARQARQVRAWPVLLIAVGAFVAIWGGWVELGKLTGFGEITPLPGIADHWTINSAITLPLGVEAYAAFALRVWLSDATRSRTAREFAKWSALGALVLGAAGQVAYHLMRAAGLTAAPWQITTAVSCLPVIVLGLGAALAHLLHNDDITEEARR